MPWLKWIEDEALRIEVSKLLKFAQKAKYTAETKFGKNVIDPFAALFEISGFGINYDTWVISETSRQAQKTLQNHVGEFHQNILGYSKGWTNKMTGSVIDLASEERKIIAEVKNKYSTISGGKLADLYISLDELVSPKASIYKGYLAYYVAIIPKKPERFDRPFTPSNKGKGAKCPLNVNIREIDGASFYDLVTGQRNSLEQLFNVLPDVIAKCSDSKMAVVDKRKLQIFFNSAYKLGS